jgi:tetratricopeptide (TPR) repeat protein
MNRPSNDERRAARGSPSDAAIGLCLLLLVGAVVAVYGRTLSVPALYDDAASILDNPSLRSWRTALAPPGSSTVAGRPVLNLSFAVNHWISGNTLASYHATNLGLHALAALALFGTARRVLARIRADQPLAMAFSIALLWAVHPLLTQAVTYTVQRAESLAGLLYLLTLYAFVRAIDAVGFRKGLWAACSAAACFLGMGTKEVMASAPLVVLLLDRTFFAGSFSEAWRRRWRSYAVLASSWSVLGACIVSSHGRGGTAILASGSDAYRYLLYQAQAVGHYLRLCLWPHPLVFDYGTDIPPVGPQALLGALLAAAGGIATLWLLTRRQALGFLGAWFLLLLAPTSTLIKIVTEPVAEHRMYLALIPVAAAAVWILFRLLGRAALAVCLALALGLGWAAAERNRDYASAVALWGDTVAKRPDNERARVSLGEAWFETPGHLADAIREFTVAVRLKPDDPEARNDLGNALLAQPGRVDDALAELREAVRLDPGSARAHNNLGNAYSSRPGSAEDAVREYREAVRLKPDYAAARNNLGNALSALPGRIDEAVASYQEALRLNPGLESAHFNLGNAYLKTRRYAEAITQYEAALALKPQNADAHFRLAYAILGGSGSRPDAIAHLKAGLNLKPDDAQAKATLWALGVDKP